MAIGEVTSGAAEIRGVSAGLAEVRIQGHVVEQVLSYEVAEAEKVYGRPFDDELDADIQMGMFAIDRIAMDETLHNVASAIGYVLDGKCTRTAKIGHCKEIEPASASWIIHRPDGSVVQRTPWSCVAGTPPISHRKLLQRNGGD